MNMFELFKYLLIELEHKYSISLEYHSGNKDDIFSIDIKFCITKNKKLYYVRSTISEYLGDLEIESSLSVTFGDNDEYLKCVDVIQSRKITKGYIKRYLELMRGV